MSVDADEVRVRDSKYPGGAVLAYGHGEWREFIAEAKAGGYDLL